MATTDYISPKSSFTSQPSTVAEVKDTSTPSSIFIRFQNEQASLPVTTNGQHSYMYAVSDVRWLLSLIAHSSVGMDALGLFSGYCAVNGWDAAREQLRKYEDALKIGMTSEQVEAVSGVTRALLLGLGGLIFVAFRVTEIVSAFMKYAKVAIPHSFTQASLILAAVGSGLFIGFFAILGAVYAYKWKKTLEFKKELASKETNEQKLAFLIDQLKIDSINDWFDLTDHQRTKIEENTKQILLGCDKKVALNEAAKILGFSYEEFKSETETNLSEEAYIGFALEEEKRLICLERSLAGFIGQENVETVKSLMNNPNEKNLEPLIAAIDEKIQKDLLVQKFIVAICVIGCIALALGALFNPVTGIVIATIALTAIFVIMMLYADGDAALSSSDVGALDKKRLKQALGYAVACFVIAAVLAAIIGTGGIKFIASAIVFLAVASFMYYKTNKRLEACEEANKKKIEEAEAARLLEQQRKEEATRASQETYLQMALRALTNYLSSFAALGAMKTMPSSEY